MRRRIRSTAAWKTYTSDQACKRVWCLPYRRRCEGASRRSEAKVTQRNLPRPHPQAALKKPSSRPTTWRLSPTWRFAREESRAANRGIEQIAQAPSSGHRDLAQPYSKSAKALSLTNGSASSPLACWTTLPALADSEGRRRPSWQSRPSRLRLSKLPRRRSGRAPCLYSTPPGGCEYTRAPPVLCSQMEHRVQISHHLSRERSLFEVDAVNGKVSALPHSLGTLPERIFQILEFSAGEVVSNSYNGAFLQ